MTFLRAALVVALVAAGVAVGYFSGQGSVSAASGGLTAQDYAEIQQLYWRYNHGADFGDPDLYVSAFTTDAFLKSSNGRAYEGRDAIRGFISRGVGDNLAEDTGRRHWNNGWRITPTSKGASARVYWLLLGVGDGQPTSDRSGYYEDVYEKTTDGWLIASRTIFGDDR